MAVKKIKVTLPVKPAKQAKMKKTYVAIVLDRSGSMAGIHKQTVEGLNEQFNAIRRDAKTAGDMEITLVQFDDVIDVVFANQLPENLKDWSMTDFQPRGMTAMNDAVWHAINLLKAKPETEDTGFLVCVISDGAENSSTEVTRMILSEEIKRLQNTDKWTFSYMLSNQDIHVVAQSFNLDVGNVRGFAQGHGAAKDAYSKNAAGISKYLNDRGTGKTSSKTFYDDVDATGKSVKLP